MPSFETEEIYIHPHDFLMSCSSSEIKELIDYMVEDGLVRKKETLNNNNIHDIEWDELCNKLNSIRLVLSNREEEVIRKIISRY